MLDADHVPTVDILEKTVGSFEHDDKLFLVQTPHFFINPDPIEKQNVKIFGRMPSENEMFYSVIQHGLDFWNSSFFCGSASGARIAAGRHKLLHHHGRRRDVAGLHARGLNSAYMTTHIWSAAGNHTDLSRSGCAGRRAYADLRAQNPRLNRG
jgi:cellulose synthase (UDP-forming)